MESFQHLFEACKENIVYKLDLLAGGQNIQQALCEIPPYLNINIFM